MMKLRLGIFVMLTTIWAHAEVIPHFAVGGPFTTEFTIFNPMSTIGRISVSFYDDNGKAMSLGLPSLNGSFSGFQATSIPAGGSLVVVASDPTGPIRSGSAVVTASSGLVTQAVFREKGADGSYYEAAVPTSQGSMRFAMPFDATVFSETGAQIFTGVAISNMDSVNSAKIVCTARNDAGDAIANAVSVPVLLPLGHWADYNFPALLGKRGLLDCTATSTIAAIGLRFLGSNAFSSLTVDLLTPATTQQSASNVVDEPNFSFAYPAGWKTAIQTQNSASASDAINQRSIAVMFEPGVPNTATTLNQCASADQIFLDYYKKHFEILATSTAQYPYTTVTYDGLQPGKLGGVSTWISVVYQQAYQTPVSQLTYVNVLPREGGMYLVQYQHSGNDPEAVSEPIRQAFLNSIVFKSGALDKNAYCNYLSN